MNFWKNIKKPIFGLSPMDGVTDAPFRYMIAKCGKPDVIYTEFVNVDGLMHASENLFSTLIYHEIERPIVAQVFGTNPDLFYKASKIVCALGFDGIDINMGCPAKTVSSRGAGAGLIKTPSLAKDIISAVKNGIKDYCEHGLEIADEPILQQIIRFENTVSKFGVTLDKTRKTIPVSVKTRIGVDSNIVGEWISTILATEPNCIAMHGRTLKEMYSGKADWDAINTGGKIVSEINKSNSNDKIIYLGNGDIIDVNDVLLKCDMHEIDGALIGRGVLGKPWFFKNLAVEKDEEVKPYTPPIKEIFKIAKQHAQVHEQIKGNNEFIQMRKHLAWYIKGISDAAKLREKLVRVNSIEEIEFVLNNYLDNHRVKK